MLLLVAICLETAIKLKRVANVLHLKPLTGHAIYLNFKNASLTDYLPRNY